MRVVQKGSQCRSISIPFVGKPVPAKSMWKKMLHSLASRSFSFTGQAPRWGFVRPHPARPKTLHYHIIFISSGSTWPGIPHDRNLAAQGHYLPVILQYLRSARWSCLWILVCRLTVSSYSHYDSNYHYYCTYASYCCSYLWLLLFLLLCVISSSKVQYQYEVRTPEAEPWVFQSALLPEFTIP